MVWRLFLMMLVRGVLSTHGICEPIRIEMCQGLGYNVTTMPNLVGHELQTDADYTLKTFNPLLEYGCSAQLHLFLCSVYVPLCTEKVPSPIGPCRGLCEQVRDQCYPVLQGFGFPWPAALNCSKFPPKNDHQHMCMEGPGEPGPIHPIPVGSCSAFANSEKYNYLNGSGRCAPKCDANILWSSDDKKTIENWMTVLVIICLISCFTAIITAFVPVRNNISTGENAIKWLTICHAIVGIGFLIRVIAGRTSVACAPQSQILPMTLHSQEQLVYGHQHQHLTQDGMSNAWCATVFIFLYYFGSVASAWWVVVCGWCYYATKKWTRTLEGRATKDDFCSENSSSYVGAVIAWGLPAVHTIAVLVTRNVDADELTGSCFVGQQKSRSLMLLVLVPQFIYFAIGTTFLVCESATVYFRRQPIKANISSINSIHTNPLIKQREIRSPIDYQRQQKLLLRRVRGFVWAYGLMIVCIISITIYEWLKRDLWLSAAIPTEIKNERPRPLFYVFLFKLIVILGGGAAAASWIWLPSFMNILRKISPYKQSPQKCHQSYTAPVMHCYTPTSTNTLPHQIHHLGHMSPQMNAHHLHQHQRFMSLPHQSHKKPRKHRKYHSGSETQV